MPAGLPLVFIVVVNLFVWGSVQEVWEKGIWKGVLQIKNTARPAAPGSIVNRH